LTPVLSVLSYSKKKGAGGLRLDLSSAISRKADAGTLSRLAADNDQQRRCFRKRVDEKRRIQYLRAGTDIQDQWTYNKLITAERSMEESCSI